jgi:hypothetical protein
MCPIRINVVGATVVTNLFSTIPHIVEKILFNEYEEVCGG